MIEIENYHLKSTSFYDFLNPKEKSFIKEKSTRMELKKRQVLFKEGTLPKGIYIVRKGKIKIFKSNSNGSNSIIYVYKKGDYFGYRPLLAEMPQPVSALAMDNVVVSFIPYDVFLHIFNGSDTLAKHICLTLAKEFTVWINKMTVFTEYSVKERVALSLLILSRVYQKENEAKVIITMNRDDLAGFVGTAKESLVRMLKIFKDERIITTHNTKIIVRRPNELKRYFSV